MKTNKLEKGQSLFEMVLAIAIMTMIIVAVVILASNAIRNSSFSKNKTLSSRYSQEATEWLRGERDTDWDIFLTRATTSPTGYCLKTLEWGSHGTCGDLDVIPGTSLIRELLLTNTSSTQIETEVKVYWEDSQGIHETKTITSFTDWRKF